MPANRLTPVLTIRNVQRAINESGEAKASAGAKLKHSYAALNPVSKRYEADTSNLRKCAHTLGNVAPRATMTIELNHGTLLKYI
jgi:hypothetical protein